MPSKLHLDFETYSELDVRRVGVFRYAEHPSTEVLIACWAIDDGPVQAWDITKAATQLDPLLRAVNNGATVGAHNAQFEHTIWNIVLVRQLKRLGVKHVPLMRAEQLDCTAARAAMCGLPRSLEGACEALELPNKKDKEGGKLINTFSKPRKPTKRDPSTRILPQHQPEKFRRFIMYCAQDVRSERGLDDALPPLPPFERRVYALDTTINARGLPIDIPLVRKASVIVEELAARVKARARKLTNGINPTQRDKLMTWLAQHEIEIENLQAKTIAALLKNTDIKLEGKIRELLELRVEASKASVKKLDSMIRCAMADDYARGTVLYYGAHTGRWAGRLIQPQNYIRGLLALAEQARVFALLEAGDADLFEAIYGDKALSTIAQVMRGFIAAKRGHRLLIVDYSQIEARVLVWLANAVRALDDYRKGLDRYKVMAAFLWRIPIEQVSKEQRRIAKNLVLGCGYGLGWRKFIEYCAKEDIILDEAMSKRAVNGYRELHSEVVSYWGDVERCAKAAVKHPQTVVRLRNLEFQMKGIWLTIRLPSGRRLYYPYPKLDPTERFGKPDTQLSYRTTYFSKWIRTSTYGGKLVENIVQGLARDIMVEGMWQCEAKGYPLNGTVHDEVISQRPQGRGSIKAMEQIVAYIPPWAKGCPITAEGFEAQRYRKG